MKILLRNLTKRFPDRNKKTRGEITAVNDLTLEIPDGKLVGLLGPSGCGKSTTLNLICGLEKATEGTIFFGDRDVTALEPEHRGVGMVFQNYALYPHLTVRQNIQFPLENLKGKDKLTKEELLLVFSVSEAEAAGIELAQRLGTAEPIPDADCRELLGQVIQLCSGCYLKSQNKYILAAKKLVQEQYSDPTLSLASVAEALGIHPNYLSKLFKTSINLNFIDYLRSYRVQRSRELLERGLSVNAVAEQTGFSSPQSFIRVFKASVGCTPGQYRKQNK